MAKGLKTDVDIRIIVCMKTTINIDKKLIEKAMAIYGVDKKTKIIEMGLIELIKMHNRKNLIDAFGSQPDLENVRRRRS